MNEEFSRTSWASRGKWDGIQVYNFKTFKIKLIIFNMQIWGYHCNTYGGVHTSLLLKFAVLHLKSFRRTFCHKWNRLLKLRSDSKQYRFLSFIIFGNTEIDFLSSGTDVYHTRKNVKYLENIVILKLCAFRPAFESRAFKIFGRYFTFASYKYFWIVFILTSVPLLTTIWTQA